MSHRQAREGWQVSQALPRGQGKEGGQGRNPSGPEWAEAEPSSEDGQPKCEGIGRALGSTAVREAAVREGQVRGQGRLESRVSFPLHPWLAARCCLGSHLWARFLTRGWEQAHLMPQPGCEDRRAEPREGVSHSLAAMSPRHSGIGSKSANRFMLNRTPTHTRF